MPRLSVIIVNYNVKHFLEQALVAVQRAAVRVSTEIIVVDNRSVDGSNEMVARRFPEVKLVRNARNVGFSAANNQGMALATGDYFLLLNPDTVVAEDTLEQTVAFMDAHSDAGGLGVKMLDGRGNFLPESKRAFPAPAVAFWKAFGFSALFPRSRVFGRYHLGYLDENQTHEVDVLAGAFMLLRRSVIDRIGGLDEVFFMYGEDIDLSYRIVQAGYKNYYFPHSPIIHYKGESTKKGSLNYVRMFYAAMKIFARKHFSGSSARLYIALLDFAISVRAVLALLRRFFGRIAAPLLDAALIFTGMWLLKNFWEQNIKWLEGVRYPPEYLTINVPLYISLWLGSIWLSGGYDRGARTLQIVRGLFFGTLLIAATYGFLEEGLRFSRGMIVSGAVWAAVATAGWRLLLHFARNGNFRLGESGPKRLLIVGSEAEVLRVLSLLERFEVDVDLAGFVQPGEGPFFDDRLLGGLNELPDIAAVFAIDEIIFCGRDMEAGDIIAWMTRLGPDLDYKIVPDGAVSIIGSNSRNTAGDLYSIDIHLAIDEPRQRRSKRLFDLMLSLLLVLSWPLQTLLVRQPFGLLRNVLQVFSGRRSWVGYSPVSDPVAADRQGILPARLPELRPGILHPADALPRQALNKRSKSGLGAGKTETNGAGPGGLGANTVNRLNLLYARDYAAEKDWSIVWQGWRELGRSGLLVLLLLTGMAAGFAQSDGVSSRNGYWMPNRDTIRVFLVFAEVVDDPDDKVGGEPGSMWPRGQLPRNADDYLDVAVPASGQLRTRMSRFFHQASFGQYVMLGDYYPKLARIPYNALKASGDENIHEWLQAESGEDLVTAHGFHFNGTDFDRWTTPSGYGLAKRKAPDGYVDFLLILWRVNSKVSKSDNSGSVNVSVWKKPLKGMQGFMDRSRFISRHSAGGGILQHEYSHSLYGGNNFHTGGRGAGNGMFMHAMGGFANLSSFGSNSTTWNAWDRHRMGWFNPNKTYAISATCVSTGREVNLDLRYRDTVACPGMVFDLDDFIDSGDALRLELPYVQSENSLARRQYLWLENHQIRPGNEDHSPRMTKGIYAYIQVGKDDTTSFEEPGLYTAPLNAYGHFDLEVDAEQQAFSLRKDRANPFTGLHFSMIPALNTIEPNAKVNSKGDTVDRYEQMILREETVYGKSVNVGMISLGPEDFVFETHPALGTVYDAFQAGDRLSVADNPAAVSVYTWESRGSSGTPPFEKPRPQDNRTIYLNGIRIDLLEQRPDGKMRIQLDWRAPALEGFNRWCGNLVAQENVVLADGAELVLDLGMSPQKPLEPLRYRNEWVFSDTTVLHLRKGASLTGGQGSWLVLRAGSRLILDQGSSLNLGPGSRLVLEPGSVMELAEGSSFSLGSKGQIQAKFGNIIDRGAAVSLDPSVQVKNKGGSLPHWCE